MSAPAPAAAWRDLLPPLVLVAVLWATFLLKLNGLDHTALTHWDEVYHANVARNVLKHPLTPTLVDEPYLPYDATKWGENHVWLHKPILPFWLVALSFSVLGVDAFALRLPAALLSTVAAGLTYLIGRELLDRRTGLIAATLQAVNPFLMTLVYGYQFADTVDVALLATVEAGVLFVARAMRTGAWRDVLLAGAMQGLAFLCKSYLAAIVFGVALTVWLLPVVRLARREDCRIGPAQLLGLLGATAVVVAPWTVYCAVAFPDEFWHEHAQVWRHLHTNVENWAAPWDRVVFDYMVAIHGVFYTPAVVALVVLIGKAARDRHAGLWLLIAWGLGVIVPHVAATTKTPSATVLALPALLLLLGHLIAAASRGRPVPLAALMAVLVVGVLAPAVVRDPGYGYPPGGAGGVMARAMWVVHHVAGALALTALSLLARWAARPLIGETAGRVVRGGAQLFCLGVFLWLGWRTVAAAWDVAARDENDPACVAVGAFVRDQLPANAVLLCEERRAGEHLTLMFYADRTCYTLYRRSLDATARQITDAGGVSFVVSPRRLPSPVIFRTDGPGGLTIYRGPP